MFLLLRGGGAPGAYALGRTSKAYLLSSIRFAQFRSCISDTTLPSRGLQVRGEIRNKGTGCLYCLPW